MNRIPRNLFELPTPKYDIITGKQIGKERKDFKDSDKRMALHKANYQCQNPKCKEKKLRRDPHKKFGYIVHFDHENGKKWDNRPSNIWVLCPTCHNQLTVSTIRKEKGFLGETRYKTVMRSKESLLGIKKKLKKPIKKRREKEYYIDPITGRKIPKSKWLF